MLSDFQAGIMMIIFGVLFILINVNTRIMEFKDITIPNLFLQPLFMIFSSLVVISIVVVLLSF